MPCKGDLTQHLGFVNLQKLCNARGFIRWYKRCSMTGLRRHTSFQSEAKSCWPLSDTKSARGVPALS